jgi:hypothetical protein
MAFKKKGLYVSDLHSINLKIIPDPPFKYLITLKTPTNYSIFGNSPIEDLVRKQIKKELSCNQIFFLKKSIEIWSNKEIDLAELKKKELLTLKKSPPYGGGALSVKLIEK